MSVQVLPIALARGQSEQELHVWDPGCENSETIINRTALECECKWGAGYVEDEVVLMLYLFHEDQTIEVSFTQNVHVGPNREMNSWDVLLSMQPESLVLAYGDTPMDEQSRLIISCKDGLMQGLELFVEQILDLHETTSANPAVKEIAHYMQQIENERSLAQ